MIKLEDLTKEELIELIHREMFKIDPKRIASVRHDAMNKKANEVTEKGIQLQKEAMAMPNSMERVVAFDKAMKVCDEGFKLYEDASKFFNENWGGQ